MCPLPLCGCTSDPAAPSSPLSVSYQEQIDYRHEALTSPYDLMKRICGHVFLGGDIPPATSEPVSVMPEPNAGFE